MYDSQAKICFLILLRMMSCVMAYYIESLKIRGGLSAVDYVGQEEQNVIESEEQDDRSLWLRLDTM